MTEEEQRARACQQILQLTEQQIVGKDISLYECFLRHVLSPAASLVYEHDSMMSLMGRSQTIASLGGNDVADGC